MSETPPEWLVKAKPHACDCGRRFRAVEALDQHQRDAHVAGSAYWCNECRCRFASELNLRKHMEALHPSGIPTHRRPSLAEVDAACLECGGEGKLVDGQRIYPHRPDLYSKRFYLCDCGAYCGCHPKSVVPLGHPCGPETRRARNVAHAVFDPLWRSGGMTRHQAYSWLAEATGIARERCHIGMMTAEQARLVVRIVNERAKVPA